MRDSSWGKAPMTKRAGAALTLTVLAAVACQDLTSLQQSNPGQLSASTAYVPTNAQILVNGAAEAFSCAFTRCVGGTGLLSDELSVAISNSSNFDYDRRTLPTSASYGTASCGSNQQPPIYTTLSTARASADTIAARLSEWADTEM